MLEALKTYLLYGNRFCGVELTSKNGEEIHYGILLKKTKKALDIECGFNDTSIETLATKLPKNQAVFLVVNNDQILTKQIESEQSNPENLVYGAFSNINLDDFYYEIISQGKTHLISICRKTYLDALISDYKTKGIPIINMSLGNLVASGISKFTAYESLFTSNARVSFENNKIAAIEKTEIKACESYDINGLQVNNNQVLSFAGALDFVLHHFESISNLNNIKHDLKGDYSQSRYSGQFLKMGLVFILGILLINFFVFNHYFNEVNTLQQTSQVNKTTKEKLLKLDGAVNKSQKMVDDMLKSSASKSSFYINDIVQGLPNSILLSELNYQPLTKSIKKDKPIELNQNTMMISGESNNSDSFSKWIADLEAMQWIDNIEIVSYEDLSKSSSKFSLKLNMIHDQQD
ncbi:hypothetical protein SAMN05428642_103101 [Flaviramulus basaltis]|uniref:Fimbrial assembly protein (PilN) n=1 Tax=Flaviramulus basaltis TaxID=369401 RepID=A0A1K2ILN7_9FLAO|nr:hypothetical protein [Flaviramulus basaltis]SFZ93381.1 hypothetical protein SAMN05428642_103101 [Flaviramulus basaltis]